MQTHEQAATAWTASPEDEPSRYEVGLVARLSAISHAVDLGGVISHERTQGRKNRSWRVITDKSSVHVREVRDWKSDEDLHFELDLARHLRACGIPFPPALTGASWLTIGGQRYVVQQLIAGREPKKDDATARQCAIMLAYMHDALDRYPTPDRLPCMPPLPDVIAERAKRLAPGPAADAAMSIGRAVERAWIEQPHQLIHASPRRSSYLCHAGEVVAVLDIDSAQMAPRAMDLAAAIRSFARQNHTANSGGLPISRARTSAWAAAYASRRHVPAATWEAALVLAGGYFAKRAVEVAATGPSDGLLDNLRSAAALVEQAPGLVGEWGLS
jgi:Ser/Thr protein kinase RdoA (MazF antagonist)